MKQAKNGMRSLLFAALFAIGNLAWAQDETESASSEAESIDEVAEDSASTTDDAAEPTWEELVDQQERIILSYVLASVAMSDAQAELADSLALKDAAAKARAEARALEATTTIDKKRLEKNTKVSKATNKKIQEALKRNEELTDQQRVEFSRSMVSYVLAVEQTDNIADEAGPFVKSVEKKVTGTMDKLNSALTEGNPMNLFKGGNSGGADAREMKRKLATGLYIGQKSPGLLASHGKTVQQIAQYTQNNDIAIPPEASEALATYSTPQGTKGVFGTLTSAGSALIPGGSEAEALVAAVEDSCQAKDGEYCMWIEAYPQIAVVVLPDIELSYSPGMSLEAGKYRVQVTAEGYATRTEEIDLTQSNQRVFIELKPEA